LTRAAGQFANTFKDVMNHSGYELEEDSGDARTESTCKIVATVTGANGAVRLAFKMAVKQLGRRKGCWMTRTLLRLP
jgi:hypothetical protein